MITRNCDFCGEELVPNSGHTWFLIQGNVDRNIVLLMSEKFGNVQVDSCVDCYIDEGMEKISRKAIERIVSTPLHEGFYMHKK